MLYFDDQVCIPWKTHQQNKKIIKQTNKQKHLKQNEQKNMNQNDQPQTFIIE